MADDRFAPQNEAERKYLADWEGFELAALPGDDLARLGVESEDEDFEDQERLAALERVLRHLGDWYTEFKVPIRETTFWKNEVLPLLQSTK